MKKILPLFILLPLMFVFSTGNLAAQLKSPFSKKSSIAADMQKVLEDYPNGFKNIAGEVIEKNPQSTEYACLFTPEGSDQCVITEYSSAKRKIASWKASMFSSEDYDEAKKKYKALYSQLNNKNIKVGTNTYHLKGEYDAPAEGMDFTSSFFTVTPGDHNTESIIVELSLHAELLEWKVSLQVYDKDRKDDERGKIKDL